MIRRPLPFASALCLALAMFAAVCRAQAPVARLVEVEPGIRLEVVDWGGSGQPAVLLAGLGATAHAFDSLAQALKPKFHVYGITRRGYGASTAPEPSEVNYAADRLGDDVVAVLDAMKIERPILMGHSFGGEELSSIGNRYPERVAGLVYLDAGYRYALSTPESGDVLLDLLEARRSLEAIIDGVAAESVDDQSPANVCHIRPSNLAACTFRCRRRGIGGSIQCD